MEPNSLTDAEIQHGAVRAHLTQESEPRHNLVIQLDKLVGAALARPSPSEARTRAATPIPRRAAGQSRWTPNSCSDER
jgi:hypothetical protein